MRGDSEPGMALASGHDSHATPNPLRRQPPRWRLPSRAGMAWAGPSRLGFNSLRAASSALLPSIGTTTARILHALAARAAGGGAKRCHQQTAPILIAMIEFIKRCARRGNPRGRLIMGAVKGEHIQIATIRTAIGPHDIGHGLALAVAIEIYELRLVAKRPHRAVSIDRGENSGLAGCHAISSVVLRGRIIAP